MTAQPAYDIAVIGGGVVGLALARGLAGRGERVAILDEGDVARRASRGNFALVWVQSKGLGMARYGTWTTGSAALWPAFAASLREETGLDLGLSQHGGYSLCLSEAELDARRAAMMRMHNQPGWEPVPWEVQDHARIARATPDGYTLAMTASGPMSILPLLQSVPYDPIQSFAHVALPSITPLLLVTPANSPTRTLPELLERLRREPGRLTACNIGVGSPFHLAAEMFARAFDVRYEQLPHRGSASALTDTVAGTCDFLFDSTASSIPLVRQGQLRALGVTSLEQVPGMPEIPTLTSQGAAGFLATTWSCLIAPAGTPAPIVARLNAEVRAFTASPAMQQRLRDQGSIPLDLTPEGFRAYLERGIATW